MPPAFIIHEHHTISHHTLQELAMLLCRPTPTVEKKYLLASVSFIVYFDYWLLAIDSPRRFVDFLFISAFLRLPIIGPLVSSLFR